MNENVSWSVNERENWTVNGRGELALKWKGEVIGVCVGERVSSGSSGGDGVRKGLLRGGPRGAIPSIIELSSGIIKSPGTG